MGRGPRLPFPEPRIDVVSMSIEDAAAEARRRRERREKALPLHESPEEVTAYQTQRTAEKDVRLEKAIQSDVRKLYQAVGCIVYNLSQARATKQSPGLGDLYVILYRRRVAWWHETKTPSGKQSVPQKFFAESCASAGVSVVVGGVRAAEDHLVEIGAAVRMPDGVLELCY